MAREYEVGDRVEASFDGGHYIEFEYVGRVVARLGDAGQHAVRNSLNEIFAPPLIRPLPTPAAPFEVGQEVEVKCGLDGWKRTRVKVVVPRPSDHYRIEFEPVGRAGTWWATAPDPDYIRPYTQSATADSRSEPPRPRRVRGGGEGVGTHEN